MSYQELFWQFLVIGEENSTYNAIRNYISKAINDQFITDDEFTFISNLYNKDEAVKNVDNEVNKMAAEIAAVIMAHSNQKNNK